MDFRGAILRIEAQVAQKWDVKIELRSDTIESGSPCNLTIWDTKSLAKSGADVVFKQGMKWLILVIRLMNTRIESIPFETGRSVMKSQDKPFHGDVGTGSGANSP